MKKNILLLIMSITMMLGLTACGGNTETETATNENEVKEEVVEDSSDEKEESEKNGDVTEITIGTSSISKDVLEVATEKFNNENDEYKVKIQVFDDAVTPNIACQEGSIDATFHQYKPYLDNWNESSNGSLVTYGPEIFAFQIGLYSEKVKSIDEISEGMTVGVSNDPSNRALALELLDNEGVIKIDENAEMPSTLDITDNPLNLKFVEMERLNLGNAIKDCDIAIVMADVAQEVGTDPASAIAYAQEPGIYLVIKEEAPWMEEFIKALTSDEVKDYINNETNQTKTALF